MSLASVVFVTSPATGTLFKYTNEVDAMRGLNPVNHVAGS
jgi:hypothetical protein